MIIGKVSSTPRNAYLRCDGKGFNSILGGFSSKGNTLSSIGGNFSNLGAHPFAVLNYRVQKLQFGCGYLLNTTWAY